MLCELNYFSVRSSSVTSYPRKFAHLSSFQVGQSHSSLITLQHPVIKLITERTRIFVHRDAGSVNRITPRYLIQHARLHPGRLIDLQVGDLLLQLSPFRPTRWRSPLHPTIARRRLPPSCPRLAGFPPSGEQPHLENGRFDVNSSRCKILTDRVKTRARHGGVQNCIMERRHDKRLIR